MTPFSFGWHLPFLPPPKEIPGLEEIKKLQPPPVCGLSLEQDPLESAIYNAASAASGAEGMTLLILQSHLKELCKLQLAKLGGFPVKLDEREE